MFYTGIDPLTGKEVFTETDYHEKQLQRALLQFSRPECAPLVREALIKCGRKDLIGYGKECLVPPAHKGSGGKGKPSPRVGRGVSKPFSQRKGRANTAKSRKK